ncbi:MBL fold metallo-hydrolase [Paludibacterium yongneupense]|uniref:MBL fold metallo-hydrolase n=1 Tax=Paludibacterium yongneupense TaxID=400061 RepID=UPI000408D0AC|nr:MBL fold metallo-hydrolase [Paludibacterium yongneupense]
MSPRIHSLYDPVTATITHIVYDRPGGHAAIIDPVLDFDPAPATTRHDSATRLLRFVHAEKLQVDWILETHAHADHLSDAQWLKQQTGGRIAVGARIAEVQRHFKDIYQLEADFAVDGSQFDRLFADDEPFRIGTLEATALAVPGHTPADIAYRIGDAVFVGDTLFMPDVGTARCDFPGGDAGQLYSSIRRLLSLPDTTGLYHCHDYPPAGRPPAWRSTVAAQRRDNVHVHDGIDEQAFIAERHRRDATLALPALMLAAIQINIRAGAMPPAAGNGIAYLRIPVDYFTPHP